ncbi:hypothetical protein NDU88_007551 [Pleurodeles waltl]|uniref:Uncharacterized protein n=1 Tax=Pleurodeles waltl TaxID=8319 RepID=A0AAV7QL32_PLEWA|nr:hypothetical protein NDU88_007551 [Pleurodeles waltl]
MAAGLTTVVGGTEEAPKDPQDQRAVPMDAEAYEECQRMMAVMAYISSSGTGRCSPLVEELESITNSGRRSSSSAGPSKALPVVNPRTSDEII